MCLGREKLEQRHENYDVIKNEENLTDRHWPRPNAPGALITIISKALKRARLVPQRELLNFAGGGLW